MKRTIRVTAIVLALLTVLTLALTGCGKKEEAQTTTVASSVTVTEALEETTAAQRKRTNPVRNVTATESAQNVTETKHQRPTGTTAASVIKNGAGSNDRGCLDGDAETW